MRDVEQKFGRRTRCADCDKLIWLGSSGRRAIRCADCAEIRNKAKIAADQRDYRERNKAVLKVACELGISVDQARQELAC